MIPSELKGNSKGAAMASISVESRGLYPPSGATRRLTARVIYLTGLGSQLVEMMMREDDSRGTFTRKRRPLSAA